MKRVVVAGLAACVLLLSAFSRSHLPMPDFLTTLSLTRDDAERYIFDAFWSDYVSHPTGARMRAVATGDRPAMVREEV